MANSYCPYCKRAKQLFTNENIPFHAVELDLHPNGGDIQKALQGSPLSHSSNLHLIFMCLLTLPLSSLTFLFMIHRKDWSENRPQHLHQGYHLPLSHFFILGDPLTHLRSVVFAVVDASSHLHHLHH